MWDSGAQRSDCQSAGLLALGSTLAWWCYVVNQREDHLILDGVDNEVGLELFTDVAQGSQRCQPDVIFCVFGICAQVGQNLLPFASRDLNAGDGGDDVCNLRTHQTLGTRQHRDDRFLDLAPEL